MPSCCFHTIALIISNKLMFLSLRMFLPSQIAMSRCNCCSARLTSTSHDHQSLQFRTPNWTTPNFSPSRAHIAIYSAISSLLLSTKKKPTGSHSLHCKYSYLFADCHTFHQSSATTGSDGTCCMLPVQIILVSWNYTEHTTTRWVIWTCK